MQSYLLPRTNRLPVEFYAGLSEIHSASERAVNLTRRLPSFNRGETSQSRDVNLNLLLTNLQRILQNLVGEKIQLRLQLHPNPLVIRANVGLLEELVMNLAVQARDTMPGGGSLILETAERVVEREFPARYPDLWRGRHVRLRFSYTGRGSVAGLPRHLGVGALEPEEAGDSRPLEAVDEIVRALHGCIFAVSEAGHDSAFDLIRKRLVVAVWRAGGNLWQAS